MAILISQTEAVAQLRLDSALLTTADVADLTMRIAQASDIVTDYLKRDSDAPPPMPTDPLDPPPPATRDPDYPMWDPTTVPPVVKGVALIILGALYDDRTTTGGYITDAMAGLLARWRDPAMA